MKIFYILIAFILTTASSVGALDTKILMKCISEVETRSVNTRLGGEGERSYYQFTQATWIRYSSVPFSQIGQDKHRTEVSRVVLVHINTIKTTLQRRGMAVNSYNVALAWNGGENRKAYKSVHRDYARRVSNLYGSYVTESVTR